MTNTKTLEKYFRNGGKKLTVDKSDVVYIDTVRSSSGYSTAYFVKQTDCDFDLILKWLIDKHYLLHLYEPDFVRMNYYFDFIYFEHRTLAIHKYFIIYS